MTPHSALVLRGRLNPVNLALGGSAVLIGLACGYAVLGLGYVDETLVGSFVGATPLGVLVILDALGGRRRVIRIDGEGVALDGDLIPWNAVADVREQDIRRGVRTWFGRVQLRRVRRLEVWGAGRGAPLAIGDEWLSPEEYAAVRSVLEAQRPIAVDLVEEGE